MTKIEEKRALRRRVRALEQTLSPRYRAEADRLIAAHVLALPDYRMARTLFCFVSTALEIDTRPILLDALAHGKRLCLPLCGAEKGQMTLRHVDSLEALRPGAFGILEPDSACPAVAADEVELAVLPCLSCDRAGHRLGRGGGYYDRFLSAYRGSAVLLCREKLLRDEIPLEPHDMPVPWVITEQGLYEDGVPARLEA